MCALGVRWCTGREGGRGEGVGLHTQCTRALALQACALSAPHA